MINELARYLNDHFIYRPETDEWRSIRGAVESWIDCWYGNPPTGITINQNPITGGSDLHAMLNGRIAVSLYYDPTNSHPMLITIPDSGESDRFDFRFSDPDWTPATDAF